MVRIWLKPDPMGDETRWRYVLAKAVWTHGVERYAVVGPATYRRVKALFAKGYSEENGLVEFYESDDPDHCPCPRCR